ncbi:MAG: type II toxin-antitoxin system HicB family antitoxin [Dehalococcoidia bacterium]
MLREYIEAAMRHAQYERLSDDRSFYGDIPQLPGVWANAATLKETQQELREVLEDWILLGLSRDDRLPAIDGIALTVTGPI